MILSSGLKNLLSTQFFGALVLAALDPKQLPGLQPAALEKVLEQLGEQVEWGGILARNIAEQEYFQPVALR
jgi:hypothetical protein